MRVRELESKYVVGIGAGETLHAASKYLADDNIGALAVFRGEKPIGLISERDLIRALADGVSLDETEVKDYMTEAPVTVSEDDAVGQAVSLMNEHGVRHVLVLNGKEVTGMVSARDVLSSLGTAWPEL